MSMKVTYIQHSGFAVELGKKVLIFDYYRGELPAFGRDRDVYVFVSHKHYDHYQRSIFTWTGKFPRITYILSSDVEEAVPSSAPKDNMYFMEPGETLQIKAGESELLIETLRSTDEGVAFVVKTAGHTIYHAGDLNDWYWIGEPDRDNEVMTRKYRREIDRMSGRTLDVAFVVLDGRQESEYDRGMNYLLEHVAVGHVFPMHCWKDYSWIRKYRAEHPDLTGKTCFHEITGEGEHFSVSLGRTGSECSCKKNEKESTS